MSITVYTKPACVQCNPGYLQSSGQTWHHVRHGRHQPGLRGAGLRDGAGLSAGPRGGRPRTSTGPASGPIASRHLQARRSALSE